METITIPKSEYKKLVSQSKAYKKLAGQIFKSALDDQISSIVEDFRKSNLYTDEFLSDLESGLRKSSLAKKRNE